MKDFRPVTEKALSVCMQDAYAQGLADLWYAVRVLLLKPEDGGLTQAEYRSLFIEDSAYNVILKEDPQNLIDKIEAFEQCKADREIHRGDEIIYQGKRGIVLRPETERRYAGVWLAGEEYVSVRYENLMKTGMAYPGIVKALERIK
jgi:hypothetical protein